MTWPGERYLLRQMLARTQTASLFLIGGRDCTATASAYYLGHPAALWITAMRPRRRPTASRYPMEAAVSGGNPTPDSGVLQHS